MVPASKHEPEIDPQAAAKAMLLSAMDPKISHRLKELLTAGSPEQKLLAIRGYFQQIHRQVGFLIQAIRDDGTVDLEVMKRGREQGAFKIP